MSRSRWIPLITFLVGTAVGWSITGRARVHPSPEVVQFGPMSVTQPAAPPYADGKARKRFNLFVTGIQDHAGRHDAPADNVERGPIWEIKLPNGRILYCVELSQ